MPILPTVDYSPLSGAYQTLTNAKKMDYAQQFADLQANERTRQKVAGAIEGVFRVGGQVYGMLEQSKFEVAKQKLIAEQSATQQFLNEAWANGKIGYQENEAGETVLRVDPEVQSWLDERQAAWDSDPTFQGFGRVRQQTKTTLLDIQAGVMDQIKGSLIQQDLRDGVTAYRQSLSDGLELAIQSGDFSVFAGIVQSSLIATPSGKEADLSEGYAAFQRGVGAKQVREAVRTGGYQAGAAVAYQYGGEAEAIYREEVAAADQDKAAKAEAQAQAVAQAEQEYQEAKAQALEGGDQQRVDIARKKLEAAKAGDTETDYQDRVSAAQAKRDSSRPLSEDDRAYLRKAALDEAAELTRQEQARADTLLADASARGMPMGLAVKDYLDQLPAWKRQAISDYVDQKRDATMWETFMAKANAPGADFQALYDQIKSDEPGKKGYTGQYAGAQVEQTRELNYLAGILGEEKKASSGASEDWAEAQIAGIKAKINTGGMNQQEAIKLLTGPLFDASPTKAQAAIAWVIGFESPGYADAIRGMSTYIADMEKKYKLTPAQTAELDAVVRDQTRALYQDNPTLSTAEFTQARTALVQTVVGKGFKLFTEAKKPGWFTDTDEGIAKFVTALEESPALTAAAAHTEAVFDRNNPEKVVINPFMEPAIRQAADRGRTMAAERLGVSPEDVLQTWQSEGAWDITALPEYIYRGDDGELRRFQLATVDGKLTLMDITDGGRKEFNPKKDAKAAADAAAATVKKDAKDDLEARRAAIAKMPGEIKLYTAPKGFPGGTRAWAGLSPDEKKGYYLDHNLTPGQ